MARVKRDPRRRRAVFVPNITRQEREAITRAMTRPDVRAFAVVVGTLDPLTERERARVMTFVVDKLHDGER